MKILNNYLLVSIIPHNQEEKEAYENIKELIYLVESSGGFVADILLQKREVHTKGSYIGKGKVEEVKKIIQDKSIDVVVLNAIVKPNQLYDIKLEFAKTKRNIEVWDRIDLILYIFSQHAFTTEAKLQIEMAAMRHMGPRIYGMGIEMSRQGGIVGTRGVGETNTELMKRHWRAQLKKAKDKLDKITNSRVQLLKRREEIGLKTVSIIGYTNAGKTSLFNKLTGKNKFVKNQLFATLDSTVGKIYLPKSKINILTSDTIGFIRDLPPELIDAFKSTLLETTTAELLIHVIDISDPDMERKIKIVESILKDLKLNNKKVIYVFNKIDKANGINKNALVNKYLHYSPQLISVLNSVGIDKLKNAIDEQFALQRF